MTVQLIVKPIGILNRPNQYNELPPGAMYLADNVYIRRSGITQPMPRIATFGSTVPVASGDRPVILAPGDQPGQSVQKVLFVTEQGQYGFMDSLGGVSPTAPFNTWQEFYSQIFLEPLPNRPFYTLARNRFFVLSDYGPVVHDTLVTGELPPRFPGPRNIGYFQVSAGPSTGGVYAVTGDNAAYRLITVRKYTDGYTLLSEPTPPAAFASLNAGDTALVQFNVSASAEIGLDVIEIYRTYIRATGVDPGPVFYKLATIPVTATNQGTLVSYEDNLPNTALTDELYTNPGQETEEGSNRIPPKANNIANYKGYTFYSDLTQPPLFTMTIPFSTYLEMGTSPAKRKNGWGYRRFTATYTNGTPTLSGISAANMIGLAIGQRLTLGVAGAPSTGTYVTALTSSTVTLSANASGSGSATFELSDQIWYRHQPATSWSQTFGSGSSDIAAALWNSLFQVHVSRPVVSSIYDSNPITYRFEPRYTGVFGFDYDRTEVIATNGQNISPQIPSVTVLTGGVGAGVPLTGAVGRVETETRNENESMFSKQQEPEAVPVTNRFRVGTGRILGTASTRDALWYNCTDGLWRLSGDGGDFRIDPVDKTLNLTGPQSWCVLRDAVYQYTNQGLVRITSDVGIENLSQPFVNELQGSPYAEEQRLTLTYDEVENEVLLSFTPDTAGNGDLAQWYVFNAHTNCFTRQVTASQTLRSAAAYGKFVWNGGQGGTMWAGLSNSTTISFYQLPRSYTGTAIALVNQGFMPIYGDDPRTVKQWQNVTHFFDIQNSPGSNGPLIYPTFNESLNGAQFDFADNNGVLPDERLVFWVPRAAAIAPMLKVGLQLQHISSTDRVWEYSGFAIEMVNLTQQQKARRG